MLRIGSGAIHVAPRVVARALRFHHLFTGKSKWEIRAGNVLMDMHMGIYIWAFGAFITTKTITSLKEHCKCAIISTCLGLSVSPNNYSWHNTLALITQKVSLIKNEHHSHRLQCK